ncbi:P-loop containing nucleoside triphosphate hydrolases superfamily protein [Rhynchospora pubera]|uniref:P-loop containing nucleoside triphosphate hydrolases superfamily protein n=1 Tax=Rhynchospora pubera TaxID=906938 RepID=A0AAV8C3Z1_9POAL|nr:P-loop containing nucleoside triphosphate hydrolases superfamily protein [Rhynchospora pubera]
MLLRGVVNDLVPCEVRDFIFSGLNRMHSRVFSEHTITIEENEGISTNEVFNAVRIYLASRVNTDMRRIRVSRVGKKTENMIVSMAVGEEMVDSFEGTDFKWQLVHNERLLGSGLNKSNLKQLQMQSFELNFQKKHKDKALNSWHCWVSVDLHHPSTFDTLTIHSELKQTMMDDLARLIC